MAKAVEWRFVCAPCGETASVSTMLDIAAASAIIGRDGWGIGEIAEPHISKAGWTLQCPKCFAAFAERQQAKFAQGAAAA
jgi:hypothetical protein